MISFWKGIFHSIFGNFRRRPLPQIRRSQIISSRDRGGLHAFIAGTPEHLHVLESRAARCEKPGNPGAWGLREAASSSSGIGRCTENLGSESCDNGIEIDIEPGIQRQGSAKPPRERPRKPCFPPPLSWLAMSRGGQRTRFLKAERKDGRLVLREMWVDSPPQMLLPIRSNGRLRLLLVGRWPKVARQETTDGPLPVTSEERWELPLVRNEGQRCVEALSADGGMPLWWAHRFETTV